MVCEFDSNICGKFPWKVNAKERFKPKNEFVDRQISKVFKNDYPVLFLAEQQFSEHIPWILLQNNKY